MCHMFEAKQRSVKDFCLLYRDLWHKDRIPSGCTESTFGCNNVKSSGDITFLKTGQVKNEIIDIDYCRTIFNNYLNE